MRQSAVDRTRLVLCVCQRGRVHHLPINTLHSPTELETYSLGELNPSASAFSSVSELLEAYTDPKLGHPAPLTRCCAAAIQISPGTSSDGVEV